MTRSKPSASSGISPSAWSGRPPACRAACSKASTSSYRQPPPTAAGDAAFAGLHQCHREHAGHDPARHAQREALARCLDGASLGRRRHDGGQGRLPATEDSPTVTGPQTSARRASRSPYSEDGIATPLAEPMRPGERLHFTQNLPKGDFLLRANCGRTLPNQSVFWRHCCNILWCEGEGRLEGLRIDGGHDCSISLLRFHL